MSEYEDKKGLMLNIVKAGRIRNTTERAATIHKLTTAVVKWKEEFSDKKITQSTFLQVRKSIEMFSRFLDYVGVNMSDMDFITFERFCEILATSNYSASSKKVYFVYVKLLIKFLFERCNIEKFPLSSDIMSMSTRSRSMKIRMVPSYRDILKLRLLPLRIERALFVEFLLSSGLRVNEMLQIRYCDIAAGDVPFDMSNGKRSQYSGGSISLNRTIHAIKNDTSRKAYFSKFATRMLRVYMKVNGLTRLESTFLIFPWARGSVDGWMNEINRLMDFESVERHSVVKEVKEESYDSLPNNIRKLMLSRKAKGERDEIKRGINSRRGKSSIHESDEAGRFSSHGARHFFATVQLFRDYRGGSNDLQYVKQLLGHTSTGITQTMRYISKVDMLDTKIQWNRLMLGGAGDWSNMIVSPAIGVTGKGRKRRAGEE